MPCPGDACGGDVRPDATADVLLCDKCRRWVHASCVPRMRDALPLAWGEYVLWRYRCRECSGGGGGTLERRHHEAHASRAVARVAVLSAQSLACHRLADAEAAAVTPAKATAALRRAGSSTTKLALGRVSWADLEKELGRARAAGSAVADDGVLGDAELRQREGAVGFRRVRDVFSDLFRRGNGGGGGGGGGGTGVSSARVLPPARPARARAALLPSADARGREGQWEGLAPLYGAEQEYTCELATDRRQPADWRVLASVTRESDSVVIVPGSFVRVSVELDGTLSMIPARVVDLLVSTRGRFAAYVQWLWTPAQVRARLMLKTATPRASREVVVVEDEDDEEEDWCAGVQGSKLEWLNGRRRSPGTLVPEGSAAAVRSDIPAYPECQPGVSTAAAVRGWARRAAKVVDVAAPPHPREIFLSLDADMVDLDMVAWEPATVHHLPAAERAADDDGSCATCECVSDSRGSRGDYGSRWDHPARVRVALQRDPLLAAPVAAAVALAACCAPPQPPAAPNPKRRRRRTSQRKAGPQLPPQHHLLQLRPTRPQYVYTYGFNSVRGGFFALPEGVCLAAEVHGGRAMDEACADALVKALRDGVPTELDLGAAAAEAAGRAGPRRLPRRRMDAQLSVVLKAGPSRRVGDGPATGSAFVAEALGVSATELAREGFRATWLQKHFPAPAVAAQGGVSPKACSRYDPSVLDDAAEAEEPQVYGHNVAEDVMVKAYEDLLAGKRGRNIEGISHVRLSVGPASPF